MLGWEFPPHITGGLGTACRGLANALVRRGTELTFVLPFVRGDEDADPALRIVPADAASAFPAGAASAYAGREADRGADGDAAPAPFARVGDVSRYGADLFGQVGHYAACAARIAKAAADAGRGFDVVHAHDWMTFPAGIAAAKAAKIPLVVHVHSCEADRAGHAPYARIEAVEQAGIDAADRVVCVSRYTAGIVRKRYSADAAKLRVVHNAPPEGEARSRRGGPRRIPEAVVLFLGRVTWQKGPGVFLDAAVRVAKARDDVKFVVAGDGDLWRRTVEQAAALGLARRVHFTGFLGAGDVDRAYRDADVFVMPSVSEPFGIAPLEAAQRGVPVLVSNKSGVAEVLPSAATFDPADPDALAAMILRVLASRSVRRRLVTKARAEMGRITWDTQAAATAAVHAELLR